MNGEMMEKGSEFGNTSASEFRKDAAREFNERRVLIPKKRTEAHQEKRRLLMGLCSAAMIVTIVSASLSETKAPENAFPVGQGYNKTQERIIEEDYQYRTVGQDREELGLFLAGAQVTGTATKHERSALQVKEGISFDSLFYPLQNGEKIQDHVIVRTELEVQDDMNSGKWIKKYFSVELQADGFQFQPSFYADADGYSALAFYNGKSVAHCQIKLIGKHGMTENTEEAFEKAYRVEVKDYQFANFLVDPDTKEYAEKLKTVIKARLVDETQLLWLGDTLRVTLDDDTVLAGKDDYGSGPYISFRNKALLDKNRNKTIAAGNIEIRVVRENYTVRSNRFYEPLQIWLVRPDDGQLWNYPLYEMMYEEKDNVQTRFETINGIEWRICLQGVYADCFCNEEPYLMMRMRVGKNIGENPLPEDFYIMMQEIQK